MTFEPIEEEVEPLAVLEEEEEAPAVWVRCETAATSLQDCQPCCNILVSCRTRSLCREPRDGSSSSLLLCTQACLLHCSRSPQRPGSYASVLSNQSFA